MPKYSELYRLLKKHSCYFVEHGTNHDKWYSPITGRNFYVPRHSSQEVKPATLRKILKDAGIK